MENNKEKIEAIFERWFTGTLSDEDISDLNTMMNDPSFDTILPEALKQQWDGLKENGEFTGAQSLQLAETILAAYPAKDLAGKEPGSIRLMSRHFLRYAAVFLIVLGIAVYFFYNSNDKQPLKTFSRVEHQDALPGSNKAVLTLADGQQVKLDSSANEQLNEKGIVNKEAVVSYAQVKDINAQNTLTTPVGGQYRLQLNDGTLVWLNAVSSITYPVKFTGSKREVSISGEVYFEVAKNKKMPFIVNVGKQQVEVLGTHFNINSYGDEDLVKTTLMEGQVNVFSNGNKMMLQPGQQSSVDKTGKLSLVTDPDIEETLAWKNGFFYFKGTDINTIMKQVCRWYGVSVKYKDKIDEEFVAEISRDVPVSKVLEMLQMTNQVHFKFEDGTISVLR